MRDENGHFSFNSITIVGDAVNGYEMGFTPKPYEMVYSELEKKLRQDIDGKIQRALIEMGWTPPSKEE